MKFFLLLLLALSGCTTLKQPEEAAWQVVNAVDIAQTVNIARCPKRYGEAGFPTREIVGFHPSVPDVEGVGVAYGILHLWISDYLRRQKEETQEDGWKAVYWLWQLGGLAYSTRNVIHNTQIGLRPFGSQCDR